MIQRTVDEIDKEIEKIKAEKAMIHKVAISMAVVLTVLYEDEELFIPKSPIYMALGYDIELYNKVEFALLSQGLVKCTAETVSITDIGRIKAKECMEILKNKKTGK